MTPKLSKKDCLRKIKQLEAELAGNQSTAAGVRSDLINALLTLAAYKAYYAALPDDVVKAVTDALTKAASDEAEHDPFEVTIETVTRLRP